MDYIVCKMGKSIGEMEAMVMKLLSKMTEFVFLGRTEK
jgi:hypothetical protein